jgi:cardiolipin synthase A/B
MKFCRPQWLFIGVGIFSNFTVSAGAARSPASLGRKPASVSSIQEIEGLTQTLVSLIKIYVIEKDAAFKNPEFKTSLVQVGIALQESGHLEDGLETATKRLVSEGIIPAEKLDEKTRKFLVSTISTAIHAELQQRGLTKDGAGRNYETWDALSKRIHDELDALPKAARDIARPEFWQVFEAQTKARFRGGNHMRLLVNGPASFAERARLLEAAKKEILVMSWAVEDDSTGEWLRERLLQKVQAGVSVRVMVDGLTAEREGYSRILAELEKGGVEVMRWRSLSKLRPFDGQHRKMLIVDNEEMVAGGLNWGDHYSHLSPDTVKPWRDTDILAKGSLVGEARRLYQSLWNARQPLDKKAWTRIADRPYPAGTGDRTVTLINHQPGEGETILRSIALALEGARKEVYIQNAYFVMDPVVARAVEKARARGVRIVVMTNSEESVDEPVVSRPIMKSVNRLLKMGVEVYLKKGKDETLHSKAMLVDGLLAWVGSQNFHPRSLRYEGEVIFVARDAKFGQEIRSMFENDLRDFTRLKEPLKIVENPMADLQEELFFDQL